MITDRHYLDTIRDRLALPDLYLEAGFTPRRAGAGFSGLCPFHVERSGSFSMSIRGGVWRGKCFGCGWSGDVIDFYAAARGCELKAAIAALGARCGLSAGPVAEERHGSWVTRRKAAPKTDEWTRPWMPALEIPTAAELAQLAALRGLQVPGLEAAVRAGHLRVCDWPWLWDGEARKRRLRGDAVRSWVVTDGSGWVGQYRPMDGGLYRIGSDEEGWRTSKSWSTKNVSWPVGASSIGEKTRVLLVEGGADLLACHHFLWGFGMADSVAPCCVLGASNRLALLAMDFFKDREVRIIMDADEPREGRAPGMEAAARWQDQLAEYGAIVTVGSLYGLTRCDGRPVKDVNDLAMSSMETQMEAAALFCEWGF